MTHDLSFSKKKTGVKNIAFKPSYELKYVKTPVVEMRFSDVGFPLFLILNGFIDPT